MSQNSPERNRGNLAGRQRGAAQSRWHMDELLIALSNKNTKTKNQEERKKKAIRGIWERSQFKNTQEERNIPATP